MLKINPMKNYLFFILFFLLCSGFGFGQTKEIDSLLKVVRIATNIKDKVNAYDKLSWALIDKDLKKAIAYNDSSYAISKKENYKEGVVSSYDNYVVLNRALGNYDKAFGYLDEYEKLIVGDSSKIAGAAFQRGVLNSITGNYDKSLKSYQQALDIYELLNNERGMGITYNTIGLTYFNVKRYEESILNFLKSIEKLKAIDNIEGLASSYLNLANAYDNIDEDDKALEYYNRSIDLSKKTSNIRRIALNKQNISSIYKSQKTYPKALIFAQEAYETLKENNYRGELTGAAANLADIYTIMGEYSKSEKILLEQLDSLKGSAADQQNLHFNLYKLYEASNRDKKALEYHKKYKKISDSRVSEKGLKNLDEIQIKYDIEKKNKEILEQQLTLADQKLAIQESKSKTQTMSILIVSLLLGSILLWFSFRQRQKRMQQQLVAIEREQEVRTLESLMEGEEKERFRIAKELHDGVNGDLAAIKFKLTSLLETNNQVINEAVAMIDTSSEQVRAISHNLVPPSLRDFNVLEAVATYCENMNAIHKPEIMFQHVGEDIVLEKKQEANLFRIVQELVTNSIKHSDANEIIIQLSNIEDNLQLTVEDDGKGFDVANVKSDGIGMQNVKSRVDYLGGLMDIKSDAKGTSFTITIADKSQNT